ncbi:MAG TPA: queuosine precursor transporter [Bryobacteraceae bacterium]|nr:queuosine precursor transporter [Bryobacteraceae bacterium]
MANAKIRASEPFLNTSDKLAEQLADSSHVTGLLESERRYKYLDTFITLFVTVLLVSNIVAPKFFAIGNLRVSSAQMLFPLTYIFGDIFTEVYGYSASRRAIWYGFFASFILVALSYLAVIIPPAPEFKDQQAFETVFKPVGRIVAASLLAYWCGEFANSFTLAKLKLLTKGRYLWTRTIGSTVVGQAVDTTVVMFAAFYGTRSISIILKLIVAGYLIKVVYETIMTPVTYAIVNYLKRVEGVDHFDYNTNFNPFATRQLETESQ